MQWIMLFASMVAGSSVVSAWSLPAWDTTSSLSLLQAEYKIVETISGSHRRTAAVDNNIRAGEQEIKDFTRRRRRRSRAKRARRALVKAGLHRATQPIAKELIKQLHQRGAAAQASLEDAEKSARAEVMLWKAKEADQPVAIRQLLILRTFMFILSVFLTIVAAAVGFYFKIWQPKHVLAIHGLNFQIIMVLELLLLCVGAFCASTAGGHEEKAHWVDALRSCIEACLLVQVFCTKPRMVLEYVRRTDAKEAIPSLPPPPRAHSSGVISHDISYVDVSDLKSSSDQLNACRWRMIIVLALRVLVRIVMRVIFVHVALGALMESWLLWSTSFVLLAIAIFDGSTHGAQSDLRQIFGEENATQNLQVAMAVLMILSQVQHFTLLMAYGPGLLPESAAGALYLWEIACAILACTMMVLRDSFADLMAYNCTEEDTPLSRRILLLFMPYVLLEVSGINLGSVTYKTSNRAPDPEFDVALCELTEEEKLLQTSGSLQERNCWRLVFLDLFSSRVRSKLLSVIVITIAMNHCVFWYEELTWWVQRLGWLPNGEGLLLAVGQMLLASCIWFICGVTLIGNNVFFPSIWLCLAFMALGWNAVICFRLFLVNHQADSLKGVTELWLQLFLGMISVLGLCIIVRLVLIDHKTSVFYRTEHRAKGYVRLILRRFPKDISAKKHIAHLKQLFSSFDDFPQLILVGAFAAVPVVLAVSFITLYCGKEILRHARIAQVFTNVLSGDISPKHVILTLDDDFDNQISPHEAGLMMVFRLSGISELVTLVGLLWQQADSNRNGLLDEAEVRSYMDRMRSTKATMDCWRNGDPTLASELLIDALDKDGNGSLNTTELAVEDLGMMLHSVSGSQEVLLTNSLPNLWVASDVDGDGELNMEELADFFAATKQRAVRLRKVVQAVNMLLMRVADDKQLSLFDATSFSGDEGMPDHLKLRLIKDDVAQNCSRESQDLLSILSNSSHSSNEALNVIEAALRSMGSQNLSAEVRTWRADQSRRSTGWGPKHEKEWCEAFTQLIDDIKPDLQNIRRRSFIFLDACKNPSGSVAHELVQRLDSNNNSRLELDEIGIQGALSLVHPDVVQLANQWLAESDAQKHGLSELELKTVLDEVSSLLLEQFGDLDNDGEATSKDLTVLVDSIERQASDAPSSKHRLGVALHSMRRAVTPHRRALLLQREMGPPSAVLSVENFGLQLFASVSQMLVMCNLDLLESFLYISALAAFGFGLYVIAVPFRGYRRIFGQMQRGEIKHIKGHTLIKEFDERMDFACFFPGIVFSTVLTGMATVFLVIFLVLFTLSRHVFWSWLWNARFWLAWLGCTIVIQLLIMRRLVLDRYCQTEGDIVRPRVFAWVYVVFVVINFALGAFAAVFRTIFMLPLLFVQIHSLDSCMLNEGFVDFDIGYSSFLTLTRVDYRPSNPIHRCFVTALNPGIHRHYGRAAANESLLSPEEVKRKRNRNRWWLALVLSKNKALTQYRQGRERHQESEQKVQ